MLRLSGSPTQLRIKATHRRVRSRRLLAAAEVFTDATYFNDFAQENIQLHGLTVTRINAFSSVANCEPNSNPIEMVDFLIVIPITKGKEIYSIKIFNQLFNLCGGNRVCLLAPHLDAHPTLILDLAITIYGEGVDRAAS